MSTHTAKTSSQPFWQKWWFALALGAVVVLAAFLRLYNLNGLPPSLYWEEAALGYDAYSILKTGKDHHGNMMPLVAFRSFGDNKPSGYFYAVVPFMAVFGLSEWAVRLPSALAGIATVIGIGILAKTITELLWPEKTKSQLQLAQLLASLAAALSPWLIQFSRGGWEVNLASTFLLWGVIKAFTAHRTDSLRWWLVSAFLFGQSMYTYHATRVIAPLLLGTLFLWHIIELISAQKKFSLSKVVAAAKPVLLSGVFFVIFISPILLQSTSSTTNQRFAETSITADGSYVKESNALRESSSSSFVGNLLTHRYLTLSSQIGVNFFSHLRPDFLFISGDVNPRHGTTAQGLFYPTDVIWLTLGVATLGWLSLRRTQARALAAVLLVWLVIGILPAALTKASPHALRILPTAAVFFMLISIGITTVIEYLSTVKLPHKQLAVRGLALIVVGVVFIQFFAYWRYYTLIYPKLTTSDWQYGYKEMVTKVEQHRQTQKDLPVFITREYGRPAMYYWFYSKTDPKEVQAAEATATKDQAEFLEYKNISFINTVNEAKPGIIASSAKGYEQLKQQFSSIEQLDEVRDLRGQQVWVISRLP